MKSLFIVLLGFMVLNCASLKGPAYTDSAIKVYEQKISAETISVNVTDKRSHIDDDLLNIPIVSFPGQHDKKSPMLSEDFLNLVRSRLESFTLRNRQSGLGELIIAVDIIKAEIAFNATAFSEKESAFVELHVKIIEKDTNDIIFDTKTASWGELASMDASMRSTLNVLSHTMLDAYARAINLYLYPPPSQKFSI